MIIAWIITGIGIFFIANSFKILAAARPNLTAGIYMYSKDGFGEYAGFTIAWGYWLCQIFGNVGYAVITMDALNYFFPGYFTGGNNIESIIGGSILIWVFNFVVLKGVQQASIMNVIGTIGKIVPLAVFIIALVVVFKWDQFTFDFWGHMTGHGESNLGGLGGQIKGTMLVTLWAFIGIEGAVVLSARAKSQKDVGRATILGFCPAFCPALRLHDAGPAGRRSQSVYCRRFGGRSRQMGRDAHECGPAYSDSIELAVLDNDYRRTALPGGEGRFVPVAIRQGE